MLNRKKTDILLVVALLLTAFHFVNVKFLRKPEIDKKKLAGVEFIIQEEKLARENISLITDAMLDDYENTNGAWDLRVAIYLRAVDAEKLYNKLSENNYKVHLLFDRNSDAYWVMVGPFSNKDDAKSMQKEFKEVFDVNAVITPFMLNLPIQEKTTTK